MIQRTPIAWKNLVEAPRRFALSCGAISFAVVLMFMQAGFRHALLDSPVKLVEALGGDLIAQSPARYTLASEQRFNAHFIQRIASDPDVLVVIPISIERWVTVLRIPGNPARTIRVIGLPLTSVSFADTQLNRKLHLLARPMSALIDRHTKRTYGIPVADSQAMKATEVELMGKRLQLVGRVAIGADFAHDGNLFVSQQSFNQFFPFRNQGNPQGIVDLALIHLRDNVDPKAVQERLKLLAPPVSPHGNRELEVLTKEELIDREQAFWAKATPIGIIFTAGMLVGFAVGVIICYQILFTEIHDHMGEFATLKAMGYGNVYFFRVVLQQSIYLATFGFLPGLAISWGLFRFLEWAAGLPMMMTGPRILLIFALTVGMCVMGGGLAIRKLIGADPAKLF
jgi:putative ABC transport system permease protein